MCYRYGNDYLALRVFAINREVAPFAWICLLLSSLMGHYCFAGWRLSSLSVVVCRRLQRSRRAGRPAVGHVGTQRGNAAGGRAALSVQFRLKCTVSVYVILAS